MKAWLWRVEGSVLLALSAVGFLNGLILHRPGPTFDAVR